MNGYTPDDHPEDGMTSPNTPDEMQAMILAQRKQLFAIMAHLEKKFPDPSVLEPPNVSITDIFNHMKLFNYNLAMIMQFNASLDHSYKELAKNMAEMNTKIDGIIQGADVFQEANSLITARPSPTGD